MSLVRGPHVVPKRNYDGVLRPWLMWPQSMPFRRPFDRRRTTQVKGGRWSVRKIDTRAAETYAPSWAPTGRPWKAYSAGRAKRHNKWFPTQEEAYAWALYVSECYAMNRENSIHWKTFEQLRAAKK